MERHTVGRAILLFSAAFLMLMIILPLLYPYGSFAGLDGSAGTIDNFDKLSSADLLTRAVYLIGDLFCHQEMSRSFIVNGSEMAFCQRDTSILAGVAVGLILTDTAVCRFYTGDKRFLIVGAIMIAATFIEWGIESVFSVDVLLARVGTAIITGAGIALLLQYGVTKEYEKVVFRKGI
jgi:uncharacterized membrane protein